ncbi:MAG: DEAD/DEAH box helicase family protein [Gemmataceae bacterium]
MSTLTEADTRAKHIDPAIHARGWTEEHIRREETAGAVEIVAGKARRRARGRMDYVLRVRVTPTAQPVAVALLEAKKEALPPGHGLDQARGYARTSQHNVPFVFASNGHLFVEFDRTTGLTSEPRPLAEFPSPDDLRARYEKAVGFALSAPAAKPLLQPYAGGEGQRRYFQDAAIRAVFEKIASRGETGQPARALLALATGTGKTFIAVNLLKRISDAGQLGRALFLCDRDELRKQGLKDMQGGFGGDAAEVFEDADGNNNAKNARVHVATYQTLGIDTPGADASFLTRHYPENYFTHVVIDECHRSAWGKWSAVLTRNPAAVQIGLTATPRELDCGEDTPEARADAKITADNLAYFGKPVYEYGLAQAMEDGYLAMCEIELAQVNLDATGLTVAEIVARNPRDANTGQPVSATQIAQLYEKTDYENRLLLPDRVNAMCWDLFHQLLKADPERGPLQKTIVFCARDRHADAVAAALNNIYAHWCASNGQKRREPYAFKCTAASGGSDDLPDFKSSNTSFFVATTVDLLTTGVNVPAIRNIAFFRYMKSPITFYQMIGRGTRIDEPSGKLMFRVFDYTGATRLFGQGFVTKPAPEPKTPGDGPSPPPPPPPPPPITVDGFEVHISPLGRYVVMPVNGQAVPVPVADYKAGMSARLTKECPTLDAFRQRWIEPAKREEVITAVVEAGYSPSVLRMLEDMTEFDLYDVLADLGYGAAPRTRADRSFAFRYKHQGWLGALPGGARAVIEAIADQFTDGGTDGLENTLIWQTPAVLAAGGLKALLAAGEPKKLLRETKERMFTA